MIFVDMFFYNRAQVFNNQSVSYHISNGIKTEKPSYISAQLLRYVTNTYKLFT